MHVASHEIPSLYMVRAGIYFTKLALSYAREGKTRHIFREIADDEITLPSMCYVLVPRQN